MEKKECTTCFKPKATLECAICHSSTCKYCAQFLEEDAFSFLPKVPPELSHTTYCHACYEQNVAPKMQSYQQTMEQAKEVAVFYKKQNKETRYIKRIEDAVRIVDCADRDETILRLAFHSALANLNSILDVELTSEKVKIGSYQTFKWSGVGIPAHVNPEKLLKDRSLTQTPN
jgi:hypothetical protein